MYDIKAFGKQLAFLSDDLRQQATIFSWFLKVKRFKASGSPLRHRNEDMLFKFLS